MSDYSGADTDLFGLPDRSKLYEFIGDTFRRVSLGYMGVLFLGLWVAYGVYFSTKNTTYASIWPNQIVYYLLLLFHILFRISKGRANILSPDMLFLVFFTMFHLGYVTLYSLNLVPLSDYIFHYEQSIPRSMFVINLGLLGFLFGYELMGIRAPSTNQWPSITIPKQSWQAFAVFLMVLSIAMHFVGLTLLGWSFVMSQGYMAIQAASRYANFFTVILLTFSNPLMAVAITIYVISSALRYGKMFHSKAALVLTVFYFIVVILEGERGSVVRFGIPLLLVRHFFVKRIKARYLVLMFIAALVLFAGLAVVRTTVFQPGKMLQEYQYQKKSGEVGWEAPFIEMGGSFLVVDIVTQDVPTYEPYWKGASWRDAAIHVVPFVQGFWVQSGYAKPAPSQWITHTYFGRGASGRAFTVAAEGYLNFGFPGAFIELMLMGLFIRWLTIFFSRRPSAMRAVIMLGCLAPAILVVRNHFNLLFSPCVQVIIIAWLLNMFLGNEPYTEKVYVDDLSEENQELMPYYD